MSEAEIRIPIFPLANVVLFPKLVVPLHIFEPRYRQMTERALRDDKQIGMVTVLPDRISEMAGDPPVFEVGCAGTIRESRRHPDGRYDMLLAGSYRFRIRSESPRGADRLYRIARVERLDEPEGGDLSSLRQRVSSQVGRLVQSMGRTQPLPPDAFDELDDESFANSLANGFKFATSEKQGLLEANGVRARLEHLASLFEFALAELGAGRTPNSGPLH